MTRRQTGLAALVLVGVLAVTFSLLSLNSVGTDQAGDGGTSPGPVTGTEVTVDVAASYTSSDIGINGRLEELDAIATYLPGRSPIVRVVLEWWTVEPCRGCKLQWDAIDSIVREIRVRDMRVLLVLAYAPPWANRTPGGPEHADMTTWFPTNDNDWSSIVDRTARHFGSDVQAYEIWNEPNHTFFGRYDGDRRQRYWELVRLAYQPIHAACDTCLVLAGASANNLEQGPEDDPASWLEWAYANGYGGFFDAVAHHPYMPWAGPAEPNCDRPAVNNFGPPGENPPCGELARVHSVMVKYGDTEKKVWGTEWGYPISSVGAPPATEARDKMVEAIRIWRSLTYTGPLFLYAFRDDCADARKSDCTFGVVRRDFSAKEPVYSGVGNAMKYLRPECVGHPASPPAVPPSPYLEPGQCWRPDWSRSLSSANGYFRLVLETNGNLVLYMRDVPLWQTGTTDGVFLENRIDGKLVLYRANGTATWSSSGQGQGPSTLHLQNDGNLVLSPIGSSSPTWATNTLRGGSLVRNEAGGVAVLVGGAGVWFATPDELTGSGYQADQATTVPSAWADNLLSSPQDGALIRTPGGALALMVGGAAIWFDNPEEATRLGYSVASAVTVPERWAKSLSTMPRDGTLIGTATGGKAVIAGGAAMWFVSPGEIREAGYSSEGVVVPTRWHDTLGRVPGDGTLVRLGTTAQVWRVTGGTRSAVTVDAGASVVTLGETSLQAIPVS
ncbi:hypothetical protein ACI2K4_34250 [Micromonospora sp. NPDC050397]|uniref:hypothetical protein n=1 Tax=Micromonospora sp. NPDC050397 TaxID=3364279 RepID=UPI003850C854